MYKVFSVLQEEIKTTNTRLEAREAGKLITNKKLRGSQHAQKMRLHLKRQFENNEITLAKLQRSIGGLYSKSQHRQNLARAERRAGGIERPVEDDLEART